MGDDVLSGGQAGEAQGADAGQSGASGAADAGSAAGAQSSSTAGGAWPPDVQAQYTRQTQQLADYRRQVEAWAQQQQQVYGQREQQLRAAAAQLLRTYQQQQQNPTQAGKANLLEQVRQLEWLDGQTAAQVLEAIQQQSGRSTHALQRQVHQLSQALSGMYQQFTRQQQAVGKMNTESRQAQINGLMRKSREALGLPDTPEVSEWLEDVYMSHEGEDLDAAFGDMARKRFDGLRKLVREMDKAEADKARTSAIPRSGGLASPSGPLKPGYKPARDFADDLAAMLNIPGE